MLAIWMAVPVLSAVAVDPVIQTTIRVDAEDAANLKIVKSSATFVHPLARTVAFATEKAEYIRGNIRDYTCRLVKRERIDGVLQPHQFALLKMRSEQRENSEIVKPLAVFMQFLAPAILADRRLLYIRGQNNDQVLVRKGGGLLKYLKLSVDPNGAAARRESNYPITDVGFDKLVDRLIAYANADIKRDPLGENTQVSYFKDAKIGERKCSHIRVLHPEPAGGMEFHLASLYVDDELQVPTRLVVYGWPEQPGETPPLNEEYFYVDVKLNVGLIDDDFSERHLESPPPRR